MKAIVYRRYGSPDVLKCEDVEKPAVADNDVLIRVRAASVNPLDWRLMRGEPWPLRAIVGIRKPKVERLGRDLAGVVEATGRSVRQFRVGDEVYGASAEGTLAEYVCAKEPKLAPKPANMTFEQAAAVPVAGITALQGLRDYGRIQAGHRVLINGASGGVGTFAIQIAKAFGAEVAAVCSARNLEMVRSLGADHAIDYDREDFTEGSRRYDIVFDCMGNHSLRACRRVLNSRGVHVVCGGIGAGLKAFALSRLGNRRVVNFVAFIRMKELVDLNELMEVKKVTPVIDRCYALEEAPEAIRYLENGHARGKVVVRV